MGLPASIDALHAQGASRFDAAGLPTQRVEAWKYTGLNRLKDFGFAPTPVSTVLPAAPARLLSGDAHRLVFVDGRFAPSLSAIHAVPDGVVLGTLATLLRDGKTAVQIGQLADSERRPMVALNEAWLEDGLVLIVPRGVVLDAPIELTFIGGASASYPRHIVRLADNASAVVLEHHIAGAESGLLNEVAEITLGAGAHLRHYALHDGADSATALSTVIAELARDASYRAFGLTVGGGLVRRENEIALTGPGATCHVDGAYLVDGKRHADTTTLVDHRAPHCASRQTLKGIVDDHGRAVFQGKVLVRPEAQKTDAYQLSRTMLLSPEAEIDVKPELEIYADDVKCSHGATLGQLDADAMFYLRARGIPERQAKAMLIQGFIDGALDEIDRPDVRDSFKAVAAEWLQARKATS